MAAKDKILIFYGCLMGSLAGLSACENPRTDNAARVTKSADDLNKMLEQEFRNKIVFVDVPTTDDTGKVPIGITCQKELHSNDRSYIIIENSNREDVRTQYNAIRSHNISLSRTDRFAKFSCLEVL